MALIEEAWGAEEVSWRELRNCSVKQSEFLDCLTLQGEFAPPRMTLDGEYVPPGAKWMNTTTPKCLIGGAGGGGKSNVLRTAAFEILFRYRELGFVNRTVTLMCDTMPNLRQIHIKKLRDEFGGAIEIKQSQEYGLNARLIGSEFEDLGRVLLRHAAQAHEASSQKGGETDALLVDELTQFTREQIGEILYQLRTSSGLPFVPFGASSNPDGRGHDHVSQLFVPAEFGGHQDVAGYYNLDKVKDAERVTTLTRSIYYIPMVRQDNPTYEDNKESMDAIIDGLENPDVKRARDIGDWGTFLGGRFWYFNKIAHTFTWADFLAAQGETVVESPVANQIEAYRLLANAEMWSWEMWASLDYGTDIEGGTCLLFHVLDHESRVWTFGEWMRGGLQLPEQAKEMAPLVKRFKLKRIYVDPQLQYKEVESKTGFSRIQLFIKEDLIFKLMMPADNERIAGWAAVDYVLSRMPDPPARVRPKGFIHATECPHLVKHLPLAPRSKLDKEDADKKYPFAHPLDAYRYGIFTKFPNKPEFVKRPQYGSTLWAMEQEKAREEAAMMNAWR